MALRSDNDSDAGAIGQRIRWLIEDYLPRKEGRPITHREFADRLGVKPQQLSRWINKSPPGEDSIRRIAEEAGVSAAWLRYGEAKYAPEVGLGGAVRGWMVAEPRPKSGLGSITPPNYEGLGIEIPERDRLHPRPREMFDRFVHQLLDLGLGREDIEYWGRTVLAPIAHMNTLHRGKDVSDATTEEEQTWIVERNVDAALRIIHSRRG